jgi:chromosome segregation ATPase
MRSAARGIWECAAPLGPRYWSISMSTDLDVLAHSLGRIRDYSAGLSQDERRTIQRTIDVLPSVDKALDASFPTLTTIDALLTLLLDPAKYKRALADLTSMVREAKASREQAQQAAADLKREQATLAPELASAKAAHERSLADAQEAFDKRVADYQKQLAVRSDALRVLEERVKADAAAVEQTKADLERRLRAVREAAA